MKTRKMQHADGRIEIVRVLTTDDLIEWSSDEPLAYEKSIVWLEDIAALTYVRVCEVRCAKSRRGPLKVNTGERVVGYAKLLPDAPRDATTQRFVRRMFYLKDTDKQQGVTELPASAVAPSTVLPGFAGERPGVKSEAAEAKR